jgi:hypothetical protein
LLAEDVARLVDPRGRHNPDRVAVRHGSEPGQVTLGGRRVRVRRPRVRSADGTHEPPVPTYQAFAATELLLICERGCSSTESSWSWLVFRWWLGVADRAGVKVERPERRVDDDLDAGEDATGWASEETRGSPQRHHLTWLGLERGARASSLISVLGPGPAT